MIPQSQRKLQKKLANFNEKIGKDNIKFLNLTDLEYNDKVVDLIKKLYK